MRISTVPGGSFRDTYFVESICVGGIWRTYYESPDFGDVLFIVVHGYGCSRVLAIKSIPRKIEIEQLSVRPGDSSSFCSLLSSWLEMLVLIIMGCMGQHLLPSGGGHIGPPF